MLTFPRGTRIFIATKPTDMRRGFDGLVALVEGEFGMQAMSGDLYIFTNKRSTQLKILFWDAGGFCILMKRLEAGTFRRVHHADGQVHVELDALGLAMLLEGVDASCVRRRRRYDPATKPLD